MPSDRAEVVTTSSGNCSGLRNKSRVSNGSLHGGSADGRSATARRFKDLVDEHTAAVGRAPTPAQVHLIRRAASLAVLLEGQEAKIAAGEQVDLLAYSQATGQFNRTVEKLHEQTPAVVPEEQQPQTHPYWHRPFHVMHDDEFAAYVEQWPDDPNPALVTEKRARAHLADLEARTTPEMRAHQQEMSDRMWGRIPREEGEGSTSSRKEKESKSDEGKSADPYAECGVTL